MPIKKPRKDWVCNGNGLVNPYTWNLVCMPLPECGLVFNVVLWKELRSAAPGMVTGGRGGNARARTTHPYSS